MVGTGVFMAHEHNHAAAFARPEAGGLSVKDAHLVARESAEAGEAGKLERIEAEIDAASDGDVYVATVQSGACSSHGQQAGSAGAINGVAAALEIKVVADAAGDGVGKSAGERFFIGGGKGSFVKCFNAGDQLFSFLGRAAVVFLKYGGEHAADIRPAQAQKVGAGKFAGERIANVNGRALTLLTSGSRQLGIVEGLRSDVEGEPVSEVSGKVGVLGNVKAGTVKFVIIQHGRHDGSDAVLALGLG